MVSKVRNGSYVPFFVSERKRSEAALIQEVQEAFVQGVSIRKIEKLTKILDIDSLSCSQVSKMAKGLDEQVQAFRTHLDDKLCLLLWVDTLYEKILYDGRVISIAILLVYGVDELRKRHILDIQPMLEGAKQNYILPFNSLQ